MTGVDVGLDSNQGKVCGYHAGLLFPGIFLLFFFAAVPKVKIIISDSFPMRYPFPGLS